MNVADHFLEGGFGRDVPSGFASVGIIYPRNVKGN
jgi:hypothetical protein